MLQLILEDLLCGSQTHHCGFQMEESGLERCHGEQEHLLCKHSNLSLYLQDPCTKLGMRHAHTGTCRPSQCWGRNAVRRITMAFWQPDKLQSQWEILYQRNNVKEEGKPLPPLASVCSQTCALYSTCMHYHTYIQLCLCLSSISIYLAIYLFIYLLIYLSIYVSLTHTNTPTYAQALRKELYINRNDLSKIWEVKSNWLSSKVSRKEKN